MRCAPLKPSGPLKYCLAALNVHEVIHALPAGLLFWGMGFFSWVVSDRKWEKQALRSEGAFVAYPPVVVRTYDDDELYERDATRLVGFGYQIAGQSVESRMLGWFPGHTKVTYRRDSTGS